MTCCEYLVDCPSDLIPALYLVGSKGKKSERWSTREWPVSGGVPSGTESVKHVELLGEEHYHSIIVTLSLYHCHTITVSPVCLIKYRMVR